MKDSWKETTLGEVAEVIGGFAFKGEHFSNTEGFPVVKITDIKPPYVDIDNSQRIAIDHYDKDRIKKFLLGHGDYLVAMTGATIGKVGRIASHERAYLNQRVAKIEALQNIADKDFVYYSVFSRNFSKFIEGYSSGSSVQQNISADDIGMFPILLPPLPEQKAIAAVLSSFDDKIELLRRQNKTLESIAQTIFKEWFVKFKVKGEELKINSKTGLPDGWSAAKLPNVLGINPVRNLKRGQFAPYLDMKAMPTQGHRAEGCYNRKFSSGSKFANGDTLLARITPCLENGKTAFVDFLDDEEVGWGSTEFIVLRPKAPFPLFYGYLLGRSNAFRNFAIGQMTGSSGRQRVPADSLADFDVIVPSDDILVRFSELIKPMVQRLKVNAKEIQTLSKLRDLLLPKLMKGEIRVKD